MSQLYTPQRNFWKNLRDFPQALSISGLIAGILVVITGYTGPILIVLEAARVAQLSDAQTASWIWAVALSNGLLTIFQSLYYRQPIIAPWSTAGATLMITAFTTVSLPQAVGAYIVCGIALALLGLSGLFGRAMRVVPLPVVSGLIAGILFNFGLNVFRRLVNTDTPSDLRQTLIVGLMIAVFFIGKRLGFRAPTLLALITGAILAGITGQLNFVNLNFELTIPVLITPEFDLQTAFTLGLPLFLLAISSQYTPGQAVLRSSGYEAPINGILTLTGVVSAITAIFGGSGATLGALTAAMVTSADSEPNIDRRYASAVVSGIGYFVFGLFGTTILAFFAGFPKPLVDVVAGLALTGTITASLTTAVSDPAGRDAGIMAFLCTASGMSLLGIGAPFWGLLIGGAVYVLLQRKDNKQA
jgi:benzoate membrane transport protein